jgi:hypothetical protein
MTNKLDMDDLLKALQEADPEQLKHLTVEMNKAPRVNKPKHDNGSVKTYTTVIKTCTCLLCDARFSNKHMLAGGEQIHCLDRQGVDHAITATGKVGEVTITSFVSRCPYCAQTIQSWTREKLEAKFMVLLKNSSFKEVLNYANESSEVLS